MLEAPKFYGTPPDRLQERFLANLQIEAKKEEFPFKIVVPTRADLEINLQFTSPQDIWKSLLQEGGFFKYEYLMALSPQQLENLATIYFDKVIKVFKQLDENEFAYAENEEFAGLIQLDELGKNLNTLFLAIQKTFGDKFDGFISLITELFLAELCQEIKENTENPDVAISDYLKTLEKFTTACNIKIGNGINLYLGRFYETVIKSAVQERDENRAVDLLRLAKKVADDFKTTQALSSTVMQNTSPRLVKLIGLM